MSFFKGFLDQWNYEDAVKAKDEEREENLAFQREALSTERQISLLKTLGTRATKSKESVAKMGDALLWAQTMVPEGTPGREEFFEQIKRRPDTALEIKSRYEEHKKAAGKAGQEGISGEDFISMWDIVQANPETMTEPTNLEQLMNELRDSDLSVGSNYVDLTERAMGITTSVLPTAIIEGDTSIMSGAQEEQQKKIHDTTLKQFSTSFIRLMGTDPEFKRRIEDLSLAEGTALNEWSMLVQKYKDGNINAGVVVTNTLNLWGHLDDLSSTAPSLNNWEKNAYFAPVVSATREDSRNFLDYLAELQARRTSERQVD